MKNIHQVIKDLINEGFKESQAEKLADHFYTRAHNGVATKEDIKDMATKEDIKDLERRMATKEDIKDLERRMATKEDIKTLDRRSALLITILIALCGIILAGTISMLILFIQLMARLAGI